MSGTPSGAAPGGAGTGTGTRGAAPVPDPRAPTPQQAPRQAPQQGGGAAVAPGALAPHPAPADPAPSEPALLTGRDRLRAALRPRATRGQVLSGALCLVLGLALVVQVRQHSETDLASLRQSELIGLLDDTTEQADRLEAEAADLTRTRDELLTSSDRREAARDLARERLDVLGVLAGTAPATGPGIELTVSGVGVDADLLLAAVQELRDAGAEAIQLNDVRVVASTYFLDAPDAPEASDPSPGPVVDVGGVLVQAPFTFSAIGSSATLASAMEFPGGVLPTVATRGGSAVVRQLDRVDITAVRATDDPAYSQ